MTNAERVRHVRTEKLVDPVYVLRLPTGGLSWSPEKTKCHTTYFRSWSRPYLLGAAVPSLSHEYLHFNALSLLAFSSIASHSQGLLGRGAFFRRDGMPEDLLNCSPLISTLFLLTSVQLIQLDLALHQFSVLLLSCYGISSPLATSPTFA
jgi:hypothetical protein